MNFVKNLIGGAVIMIVATIIGVAQNAIRSDAVALFPKVSQPARNKPPGSLARDAVKTAEESVPAEIDLSPDVTEAELAAEAISKERVRVVADAGTAVLIDARAEHEYEKGHLPGAINIPYTSFIDYHDRLLALVQPDAMVIVYCTSVTCDLGEKLAYELKMQQYQRIVLYHGGWDEWSEAGYPTETGESPN